jgi:hypothetical protein
MTAECDRYIRHEVGHFNMSDGRKEPIFAYNRRLIDGRGDDVTDIVASHHGRRRAEALTNPRKFQRGVRKVRALDRKAQRATGRQADRYQRQATRLRRQLGIDTGGNQRGRRGGRGGGRR